MKRVLISIAIVLSIFFQSIEKSNALPEMITDNEFKVTSEESPENPVKDEDKLLSLYDRVIRSDDGYIGVKNDTQTLAGGTLETRSYTMYNSDMVVNGRFRSDKGHTRDIVLMEIPCGDGTLRMYKPDKGEWYISKLSEGRYSSGSVFVTADNADMMWYLPKTFREHENATLEYLPNLDGYLQVKKTENGFLLQICSPSVPNGCSAHYLYTTSPQQLIDWNYPNAFNLWRNYTQNGDGLWLFDGYYWPASASYVPSGPNYFYRMTDAYLCRSFNYIANAYRLAEDLSLCMLDVMADQQNGWGYFPTMSGSTWLEHDYGIKPGFYDTRFNSDLIEMFIYSYQQTGADRFYNVLNDYADFFFLFAGSNHQKTLKGGWLVEDYWHPGGSDDVHTSLNHQLAEASVMYKLSDLLSRKELADLADKMIQAIADTEKKWYGPKNNLEYGLMPDGTAMGTDYPYLTYNDLYDMQVLLKSRFGNSNTALQRLMDSKKIWMDRNNITAYKGYTAK